MSCKLLLKSLTLCQPVFATLCQSATTAKLQENSSITHNTSAKPRNYKQGIWRWREQRSCFSFQNTDWPPPQVPAGSDRTKSDRQKSSATTVDEKKHWKDRCLDKKWHSSESQSQAKLTKFSPDYALSTLIHRLQLSNRSSLNWYVDTDATVSMSDQLSFSQTNNQ